MTAGLAAVLATALFGLTATATADSVKDPPRFPNQSDYSSAKHWFLEAERLVPHGRNPFFFPLVPGHKHILERPDHPDGSYRKETLVLDETEPFDVPGIGKFEAAIVQEEEFVDEELNQRVRHWLAIDRMTNSVHVFGQVSWEIDEGRPIFTGTWRAGDSDGSGTAQPGLLMPGIVTLGSRYVLGGNENEAVSGSEVIEVGIEKTVPAGTFRNCARVREQGLLDLQVTDRIWCPRVGLVADTSSGNLIASSALPPGHPGSDLSSFGKYLVNTQPYAPPVAKITPEQATEIALKAMPGRATSVVIERKRGKHVYVVEIQTRGAGEKDVFVDIETGEVVGTD